MEIIQMKEILNIYNACGLSGNAPQTIRYQINTGSLNNTLNSGTLSKNVMYPNPKNGRKY